MKTKEEVLALLMALGSTSQEVAEKLIFLGIRGNRRKCKTCPVAKYLINNGVVAADESEVKCAEGVGLGVRVSTSDYYWYSFEAYQFQLTGVRNFILAFDRGEYPQCDADDHPLILGSKQ